MGFIIGIFLSVGHVISQQIRCLGLLSMPTFCDKSGQRVLVTLIFAYVIGGPMNNIAVNGSEVIRVFTCSGSLAYNLTKTRYELMFKPFQEAIFNLRADTNEVKETINSVNDVIDPIKQEFESDEEEIVLHESNDYLDDIQGSSKLDDDIKKRYKVPEPEEVEKMYKDKLRRKCESIIRAADEKCKAAFGKAHNSCKDSLHWSVSWALCWPMQITFVCNLTPLFGGGDICNPEKSVNSGFGKGYVYLTKAKDELRREFLNVKINYKLNKPKIMPEHFKETYDATTDLLMEFREKRDAAEVLFLFSRRFLAFSFLKVILDSHHYLHKYLTDIEHDNMYISKYFRKIDGRRKKKNQHTLLPLKKTEKKKFINLKSMNFGRFERKHLFTSLIKLFFEIMAASSFVVLDATLYEALDVIRRHARIDYFQTGHHDMSIKVKGTGMIANLLRAVVDRFNFKKNVTINLSNEACLPKPHRLDHYYIQKIYGTFFLVFLMVIFTGYTNRMKRLICAAFFRKREKRRILFLYNETLRKRIAFFRYMKHKVEKMAKENKLKEDLNVFLILRFKFPKIFGWLAWSTYGRRKCLICGEPETMDGKKYGCNTEGCVYIHCEQCWSDVGICYGCSEVFKKNDNYNDVQNTPEGYIDTGYSE
ncbi:protein sneaky [Daktulosphaira vitifoliae]|uniref:protein sneaky n=1 Tax=Daktulosphaira vitifoliae TaxID=58002 RepID=UPI0021AAA072|nr:protein sneaky [Daktulosphaira vitifoliae]